MPYRTCTAEASPSAEFGGVTEITHVGGIKHPLKIRVIGEGLLDDLDRTGDVCLREGNNFDGHSAGSQTCNRANSSRPCSFIQIVGDANKRQLTIETMDDGWMYETVRIWGCCRFNLLDP